ncbi:MAG TPA: hypothetical protein VHR40_02325 [Thermoleophilaceae bacterium]|jgi:hypothetical protein|nr:hypothetical protein [Thermoleophilaceae bacterium]
MRARTLAIALALAALCAAPSVAAAHTLDPAYPQTGDGGTVFSFFGRAWQKGGVIQAQYYRVSSNKRPFRTKNFRAARDGTFLFRLYDPWAFEIGTQERMCFVQYDTRRRRTFRKCASFYVEPPRAYFMAADGSPGDLFILVANGFQANRTLQIQLTTPVGEVQSYTMRTLSRPKFLVTGFGPVFIPRGGAIHEFQSNPTDPTGLYTAFVKQSDAPARARASVLVTP